MHFKRAQAGEGVFDFQVSVGPKLSSTHYASLLAALFIVRRSFLTSSQVNSSPLSQRPRLCKAMPTSLFIGGGQSYTYILRGFFLRRFATPQASRALSCTHTSVARP